ncbi:zinc knuckle CX2CX4HX4C containing protein [Tanacetum coccineum]
MDAIGTVCKSIQADNNNTDVIPCKVSHVDDSINLNVDESTIFSVPIVQSVDINTKSTSYAGAAGASAKNQPKVNFNFRTLVADPVFKGVNISIPRKVVEKVSTRFEHTLYGYFIGKRMAFSVVKYYARNNWAKHELKRIIMNSKGFFFFKFDSRAGLEAVLKGGPWLIHKSLIILKKWSMDTRLLKEELTRILIWVKLHDVSIQVFEEDSICLIATFIGKLVMLDSYTSYMCNESWGRSSFARCLIEVNLEADLVDVVTIGIPSLSGDGFTKETIRVEYEWRPPRCDICKIFGHVHNNFPKKMASPSIVTTSNVVTPTVEKTNDGFQTVGKKKNRKGKSKSTNGGQFAGPLIKQHVRYEPKATTSAPKKGVTNVYTLRASCGELDAQPSPPDEGVMTFLRKKVKTGAVVGKRVLLQVSANLLKYFLISDFSIDHLYPIESHKSSTEHPIVNEFIIINIPEEDVEPEPNLPLQEIIILDPDDQPMWENAKIVAPTPNSAIVQPNVDDNFVINSTHLNMIRENKFDGYLRADPHDHIREFLAICNMFRYGKTQSEAVKLMIFPLSLCDEAKFWWFVGRAGKQQSLNEESITSWEQMRKAFINRFFPPSLFNRLLLEIRNFSQLVFESLTDAWLRLKSMLRKCHGHGLTKGAIIQIFYHSLDEPTQGILDKTAGGIFLYKTPNQAFQFLEDKVLFNLDWSTKSQNEHHRKFVSFADGSDSNTDNSQFMEKLKAMYSQIISLNEELQDIRNKYNELREGNTSKNHLNDDTPMCERHEANYI